MEPVSGDRSKHSVASDDGASRGRGEQRVKDITAEQYKLLASPLRIRILHRLAESEATAAQVADDLGETRGNVHYHLRKLYEGGLVDLTRTEQLGGVLERYYRAPTARFRDPRRASCRPEAHALSTWIERTPEEMLALLETLEELLLAWERQPSAEPARARIWKLRIEVDPVGDGQDAGSPAPSK